MLNKNRHLESDSIRWMIDVCQSWSEPVLDTCQFFFVPKDLQSHVVTRPVDFFQQSIEWNKSNKAVTVNIAVNLEGPEGRRV